MKPETFEFFLDFVVEFVQALVVGLLDLPGVGHVGTRKWPNMGSKEDDSNLPL